MIDYKQRLETLEETLRNCTSGAEIHIVGNLRNSVRLLLDQIETKAINDLEGFERHVKSVEDKVVEFFKNKFNNSLKS